MKYLNGKCHICPYTGDVIRVWGKLYCNNCYKKRPKKGKGNSGMVVSKTFVANKQSELLIFTDKHNLFLQEVPKSNKIFVKLYLTHYPKSKGIVGRCINYIIRYNGKVAGIIGINSPPLNYLKFKDYFNGISEKNFVNNNAFRLIIHEKNLGTKVLKIFREKVKKRYKEKYGDDLKGIVTFVELPRTGAIYKADNWDYLGLTEGFSSYRRKFDFEHQHKEWSKTQGKKKLIFAKKL